MEKKTNKYHLTLALTQYANGDAEPQKNLAFDFDNHDEIFNIMELLRQKDPFNNEAQANQFALGLKLFSEVMLKNRNNLLFYRAERGFSGIYEKVEEPVNTEKYSCKFLKQLTAIVV